MRRHKSQQRILGHIIFSLALLAACASAPEAQEAEADKDSASTVPVAEASQVPSSQPLSFVSSGHEGMDLWRLGFAASALAAGFERDLVQATLAGIAPLDLYLGERATATRISGQAEFARPIWDYVSKTVTDARISAGAVRMADLSEMFDRIEAVYGVDRAVLIAIWAMETNLGTYIGTYDAVNTLSNMAVEGRRQRLAEAELMALMKLQESGQVSRRQLVSGWAGAMGQTQFMPSTFLNHAVDFDGDGRKDLWNSVPDALASAANYLRATGFRKGVPWGIEVLVPSGFDWSLADGQDRRLSSWTDLGLRPIGGGAFTLEEHVYAQLWLPAGASGPKYLLLRNFEVFKAYNRSDSYALSVGLLSDRVQGLTSPVAVWPVDLELLSAEQTRTLQIRLNQLGFYAGPVDGIAGRGTRAALRRFQVSRGIVPADGFPTNAALEPLLSEP